MKTDLDVTRAFAEGAGRFRGVELFDVAHEEDGSIGLWQLIDRVTHGAAKLLPLKEGIGRFTPIDDGLLGRAVLAEPTEEILDRQLRTPLTRPDLHQRCVDHDSSQPVPDAARTIEFGDSAIGGQEGRLHRVFRVLALAKRTRTDPATFSYEAMTLVGLVGLLDPPRTGVRQAIGRRWLALAATSVLFSMEHIRIFAPDEQIVRQLIFTVSLGLLLGLLIMVSANLHLGAGIHAWINWLLLGAAPHFVDASGRPALPPGTYIGLTLILAFGLLYLYQRRRHPKLA